MPGLGVVCATTLIRPCPRHTSFKNGVSASAATANRKNAKEKGSRSPPPTLTTVQLVAIKNTKQLSRTRPRTRGLSGMTSSQERSGSSDELRATGSSTATVEGTTRAGDSGGSLMVAVRGTRVMLPKRGGSLRTLRGSTSDLRVGSLGPCSLVTRSARKPLAARVVGH